MVRRLAKLASTSAKLQTAHLNKQADMAAIDAAEKHLNSINQEFAKNITPRLKSMNDGLRQAVAKSNKLGRIGSVAKATPHLALGAFGAVGAAGMYRQNKAGFQAAAAQPTY